MRSGEAPRAGQRGFAYLLLLALVAVLGIAAAGSVQVGERISRRHAEQALLVAGEEFRAAIASYRRAGGDTLTAGPAELADLLRDPRTPGLRRHLRLIREDPLTGKAEWGVVRDAVGRIRAVHSLAEGEPIKRDGFDATQVGFENASSYAQWQFGPPAPVPAAASAPRPPTRLDR